ncbi:MAG: GYF domain-containing protein [Phycisphaerales bacterium]|nr:GYF domain-containing protein [Phycisphaerales bacterium]
MSNFEVQRNGQNIGSFHAADLKAAALDGRLQPTDMVCPEGTGQWREARSIAALQFGGGQAAAKIQMPSAGGNGFQFHFFALMVDKVVELIRLLLSKKLFTTNMVRAEKFGHLGILVVMVFLLVLGVITTIKTDSISVLIMTLGSLVALILAQYSAFRFLKASRNLLESTPSTINGKVLLDVIALVLALISVGFLIIGCFYAIKFSMFSFAVYGFFALVIGLLSACVAFNPDVLNIQQSDTASAGEEAIGLASFFVKCLLVLGPFVYFFGALASCYALFEGIYYTMKYDNIAAATAATFAGTGIMVGAGFYTLVFYIVFLVYYLLIDVLGAILSMGRNVRKMAGEGEG